MSGLGIDLRVNSQEVKIARQEIKGLNDLLNKTEGMGPVSPLDKGEMSETLDILSDLSKEINRLRTIATQGGRQGGLLKTHQFKEAEELSSSIKENFSEYEKYLTRAENKLEKMVSRRRELVKLQESAGWESTETKKGRQKEIDGLSKEIGKLADHLDKITHRSGKSRGEFDAASGRIGRFGLDTPSPMGGMKKMFGILAAVAGVGSILSEAQQAIAKTTEFETSAGQMIMRGAGVPSKFGRNLRTASENMMIADMLNRSTGRSGGSLTSMTDTAARFATTFGADDNQVTGYMAGIWGQTKMEGRDYKKHMGELSKEMKKLNVGGLVGSFLDNNRHLIQILSKDRGGTALSGGELSLVNAIQSRLWSFGVAGQEDSGKEFVNKLQSGITGGGKTPMQKMFLYNALGGASSYEEYYELERLMSEGITGTRDVGGKKVSNVQSIMRRATDRFGTDKKTGHLSYEGRGFLKDMFNLTPNQADMLAEMHANGVFDPTSASYDPNAIDGVLDDGMKKAGGLTSGKIKSAAMKKEDAQLGAGEILLPPTLLLKDAMAELAKVTLEAAKNVEKSSTRSWQAYEDDLISGAVNINGSGTGH